MSATEQGVRAADRRENGSVVRTAINVKGMSPRARYQLKEHAFKLLLDKEVSYTEIAKALGYETTEGARQLHVAGFSPRIKRVEGLVRFLEEKTGIVLGRKDAEPEPESEDTREEVSPPEPVATFWQRLDHVQQKLADVVMELDELMEIVPAFGKMEEDLKDVRQRVDYALDMWRREA